MSMKAALLAPTIAAMLAAFLVPDAASALEVVRVYGSGGPAPALQEAAAEFARQRNVEVQIQTGPMQQWLTVAREDADLLISSSEHMMSDFVAAFEGRVVEDTITPLFLRPSAILVRPGNPKEIAGLRDLLKPDMSLLVVSGGGQAGLWEDVVGRLADIAKLRDFRRNVGAFARTGEEAMKLWTERRDIDAWLTWSVWAVGDRIEADIVPVENEFRIWRPMGVALTRRGQQRAAAVGLFAFMQSPDGRRIFEKGGWIAKLAEDPVPEKPKPKPSRPQ